MNVNIPVSVGELIDKLTILEIKLAEMADTEKLANVRREYETLQQAAPAGLLANDDVSGLREKLKELNAELWAIEDKIRVKERARLFDEAFIALARAVYITNDRRAALKREINILSQSDLIEEKSYASY